MNVEEDSLLTTDVQFSEVNHVNTMDKSSEQNVQNDNMIKFHNTMKMLVTQCVICKEAWPMKNQKSKMTDLNYTCCRCKRDKGNPKKFSEESI